MPFSWHGASPTGEGGTRRVSAPGGSLAPHLFAQRLGLACRGRSCLSSLARAQRPLQRWRRIAAPRRSCSHTGKPQPVRRPGLFVQRLRALHHRQPVRWRGVRQRDELRRTGHQRAAEREQAQLQLLGGTRDACSRSSFADAVRRPTRTSSTGCQSTAPPITRRLRTEGRPGALRAQTHEHVSPVGFAYRFRRGMFVKGYSGMAIPQFYFQYATSSGGVTATYPYPSGLGFASDGSCACNLPPPDSRHRLTRAPRRVCCQGTTSRSRST